MLVEVLARSGMEAGEISAIGITNQRETTIVWEKHRPSGAYNAIVWQCRRTSDFCTNLVERGYATRSGPNRPAHRRIFQRDKNQVDPGQWRAHVSGPSRGELLFGTVDTWLIWKLTGGAAHVTDVTNASRTMLFNIHRWNGTRISVRCSTFQCMLPKVCDSSMVYGVARIGGAEIPIVGAAGDQQAALFGQTCFARGRCEKYIGTGCFMLMNTGDTPGRAKTACSPPWPSA